MSRKREVAWVFTVSMVAALASTLLPGKTRLLGVVQASRVRGSQTAIGIKTDHLCTERSLQQLCNLANGYASCSGVGICASCEPVNQPVTKIIRQCMPTPTFDCQLLVNPETFVCGVRKAGTCQFDDRLGMWFCYTSGASTGNCPTSVKHDCN